MRGKENENENGNGIVDFIYSLAKYYAICCISLTFSLARDRHTLSGIFKINFYRLCGWLNTSHDTNIDTVSVSHTHLTLDHIQHPKMRWFHSSVICDIIFYELTSSEKKQSNYFSFNDYFIALLTRNECVHVRDKRDPSSKSTMISICPNWNIFERHRKRAVNVQILLNNFPSERATPTPTPPAD